MATGQSITESVHCIRTGALCNEAKREAIVEPVNSSNKGWCRLRPMFLFIVRNTMALKLLQKRVARHSSR